MELTLVCKCEANNQPLITDLSGVNQRERAVGDKIIEISHDSVLPKENGEGPVRIALYGFTFLLAMAAIGDVRLSCTGCVTGVRRIGRHLLAYVFRAQARFSFWVPMSRVSRGEPSGVSPLQVTFEKDVTARHPE